jgi:hypothetical protein
MELNRGNLRQKDWQDVADAVNALHGHTKKTHRTDVQCKNRIDTIKKKYKIEEDEDEVWIGLVLGDAQIADFRVRDDEGARVPGVSAGSGRSNGPVQRHAARPTTSSMSSTVESFSRPRVAAVVAPPRVKVVASVPPLHPAAPDDCRSDCGSSSSVVQRKFLPFDLNLPPPMVVSEESSASDWDFVLFFLFKFLNSTLLDYYVRIVVIWIAMRSGVSSTFMAMNICIPWRGGVGYQTKQTKPWKERERKREEI